MLKLFLVLRVMTLNNQPALISVGKELFYKIKSSSTASSGGGAVAAEGELVDSVFAGILLDITPEIDDNGMITLKINPSVSETVDTVTSDGGVRTIPPDLVRRQIASVIKVKDGQHAILRRINIKSRQDLKTITYHYWVIFQFWVLYLNVKKKLIKWKSWYLLLHRI